MFSLYNFINNMKSVSANTILLEIFKSYL